MKRKLICKKCKTPLVKVRDFIRQSGYSYYFECPNCDPMRKELEKIKKDKDKK